VSATARGAVEYRSASETDLAGEFEVFMAAVGELRTRRGAPFGPVSPFDPEGRWAQVHHHLLAHDGERSFVAEQDGRIVGFTAALVRGDCWFFSALFIDPAHQHQGIGGRLLDLAWDKSCQRRITITEAIQPVSTGLYARRGLLPVTPVLGFAGRPAIKARDDRFERTAPAPSALRAIDLAAYGFDRKVDHEFWARTSSEPTVWLRDGKPCAYSYAGLFGIGPVAGLDGASAAHALRAELASRVGQQIRVDIPGTATALVQVALEAGLRLDDPGLLLLSPPAGPPTALAIHSYWML
jgi:GNAT superfamily N-acetyltransferase